MSAPDSKHQALLHICRQINRVDDRLGQRSDYEGQEDGPTYHLFNDCTRSKFNDICDAQIEAHSEAIRLWWKLKQLKAEKISP